MNSLTKIAVAATLATSLSGCVIVAGEHDFDGFDNKNWKSEQNRNKELISQLSLQADRFQVEMDLGTANFSEAFMNGDDEYRVLYYRTQRIHADDDTTKDETTPLVFKNDKLIGWGHDVLASVK